MDGSQNPEWPMLLRWPDGIRYDQQLVCSGDDGQPDWALRLVGVVLWMVVPAVFWGMAAWSFR
jgi:hypothetical protein